jgi:hypothetical protein
LSPIWTAAKALRGRRRGDVRIAGGSATILEHLNAGLVNEAGAGAEQHR